MSAARVPWDGNSVVLRNVNLPAAALGVRSGAVDTASIRIDGGVVTSIGEDIGGHGDVPHFDCRGGLALPASVDCHTHLDKGHIWPRSPNLDGSFAGAIEAVRGAGALPRRANDIRRRMDFALRCAHAHGTAAIRTHLDSAPLQRDLAWSVFDTVRQDWKGLIELQAVALISFEEMLDKERMRATAAWVKKAGGILGGAIATQPMAQQAITNLVEAAGEYSLDLDLHCDETLDPNACSLRYLADAVMATGYEGHVQAGHCCALSLQDQAGAMATIEKVAMADIAIVALPMCNMYLQDRQTGDVPHTPRNRGVTLVKELKSAGLPVSLASDNTRDPFYAYGDLDMVEVFREAVRITHIDHPQEKAWDWLRAITCIPASQSGFDYQGSIATGQRADIIITNARNWTEFNARSQADRIVVRNGSAINTTLPDYRELDDLMEYTT